VAFKGNAVKVDHLCDGDDEVPDMPLDQSRQLDPLPELWRSARP